MSKNLISKVLKTLMFKKSINTSQLARDLNLPQQTLQRIVSGTSSRPHPKTLKPIADFFDVSVEQLKGESPLPESVSDIGLSVSTKPTPKAIPVVAWDELAQYLENPDSYHASEHVFGDPSLSDKTFALGLPDSSMEPFFPKGSLLILDPDKPVTDRCFVLSQLHESRTTIFRQLLIDGERRFLKPLNPDLTAFPMRLLNNDDKVLGVMIEFRHRYDNIDRGEL